ncbi:MAG: D-aminoacylase [Chloroflexota bacterium]|nr:D-aminoacylase [Chloroflexota bacterium]
MTLDTVILNGTVIDGSGNPGYQSDIGIRADEICTIGNLENIDARRHIDASELVVAPGFIDIHGHSDITLLKDPGGESKVYQGVTTEVTGNCSFSPFPAGKHGPDFLQKQLGRTLISNFPWTWSTLDEWAHVLGENGVSLNIAPQLGHAALRVAAGALHPNPATKDELKEMKKLACQTIEQGAFALTTGLSGPPSGYADTNEIIDLCSAISRYDNAFYATHARVGPGRHKSAIEEAVRIGTKSEIPVQFSHLSITEVSLHGRSAESLKIFEDAYESGLDISYDVYPYTAAGGGLKQVMPAWAQAGTTEEYMGRLSDSSSREIIKSEVATGIREKPPRWETWFIAFTQSDSNAGTVGKSVETIAAERGVDPAEAVIQMVESEGGNVMTLVHNRAEEDVRLFLQHSLSMIGSDGRAIAPDGFYGTGRPHPRFYGTYPRILGKYVREKPQLFSIETAIHKMTGAPATRMGFKDRGILKKFMKADLVIFDPRTVIDSATFENPQRYPQGMPYVLVNGKFVVDGGQHTGARPGQVLRRGA